MKCTSAQLSTTSNYQVPWQTKQVEIRSALGSRLRAKRNAPLLLEFLQHTANDVMQTYRAGLYEYRAQAHHQPHRQKLDQYKLARDHPSFSLPAFD